MCNVYTYVCIKPVTLFITETLREEKKKTKCVTLFFFFFFYFHNELVRLHAAHYFYVILGNMYMQSGAPQGVPKYEKRDGNCERKRVRKYDQACYQFAAPEQSNFSHVKSFSNIFIFYFLFL